MVLKKLFGGGEDAQDREAERQDQGTQLADSDCPHMLMIPRWDAVEDMGDESKAVGYKCDACGALLSLEDAAELRNRRSSISL